MPLINIPREGECLRLEEDFTFKLYHMKDNSKLIEQAKIIPPWARLERAAGNWAKLSMEQMIEYAAASGWTMTAEQHMPHECWRYFTLRAETEVAVERYVMQTGSGYPASVVLISKCWVSCPPDDLLSRVPRMVKQIKFRVAIEDINRMRAKRVTRHW